MVTDIGIELGRGALSVLRPMSGVTVDGGKLRVLVRLVFSFLGGGVVGAVGYGQLGFFFSLSLATILLGLGLPSLLTRQPKM